MAASSVNRVREVARVEASASTSLQVAVQPKADHELLDSELQTLMADSAKMLQSVKEKLPTEGTSKYEFTAEDLQQLKKMVDELSVCSGHARRHTSDLCNFLRQQAVSSDDAQEKIIADMRQHIANLEDEVAKLRAKLQLSECQLARLTLRQMLKSIETTIYKHFVRSASSAKRDFKLRDLERKIKSNDTAKLQLKKLLDKIGFDPNDSTDQINDLIEGYSLHDSAHQDVEVQIPDDKSLKDKLRTAEITDDDKVVFMGFSKIYFTLKKELAENSAAYSEVLKK